MNPKEQQQIWHSFLLVGAVVVACVVLNQTCACASSPLRPEDEKHIEAHGETLARCAALARADQHDAGPEVWTACKRDAGIEK